MIKMNNIDNYMLNYNEFIRTSLSYLSKAGVEVGDDGWEDFLEHNFAILVQNRVGDDFDYWIDTTYAVHEQGNCPVLVRIRKGSTVNVGVEKDNRVRYQQVTLSAAKQGQFVEFQNPLTDPLDTNAHLRSVLCYAGQERLVAELSDCEFIVG